MARARGKDSGVVDGAADKPPTTFPGPRQRPRRRHRLAFAAAAAAAALAALGHAAHPASAQPAALAAELGGALASQLHRGRGGGGLPGLPEWGLPEWDGLAESASAAFSDVVLMDSPVGDFVSADWMRKKGGTRALAERAVDAAERAQALKARAALAAGEVSAAASSAADALAGRPAATSPTGYGLYGKLHSLSAASGAAVPAPKGVLVQCWGSLVSSSSSSSSNAAASAAAATLPPGSSSSSKRRKLLCSGETGADGRFACKILPGLTAKAARAGMLDPVQCEATSPSTRPFVSPLFAAALGAAGGGAAPLTASEADPLLWALPRAAGIMATPTSGGAAWRVAPMRRCAATAPAAVAGSCDALAGGQALGAGPAVVAAASSPPPPAPRAAAAPSSSSSSSSSSSTKGGGLLAWARKAAAGLKGGSGGGGDGGATPTSAAAAAKEQPSPTSSQPPAAPLSPSPAALLEASFDGACAQRTCCFADVAAAVASGGASRSAAARRRAACDLELRDSLESLCRGHALMFGGGQGVEGGVCSQVVDAVARAASDATAALNRAAATVVAVKASLMLG